MKKFLLSLAAAISAIAVISILLAMMGSLDTYKSFVYNFFMFCIFGCWIYIPIMIIHHIFISYIDSLSLWISAGVGVLVCSVVMAGIILSKFISFTFQATSSHHQIYELAIFSIGGLVYGLLYFYWVQRQSAA